MPASVADTEQGPDRPLSESPASRFDRDLAGELQALALKLTNDTVRSGV